MFALCDRLIQKNKFKPDVIAIEGDFSFKKHSTVVKVDGGNLKLIREGEIDFSLIKMVFDNDYPLSNVEDWT